MTAGRAASTSRAAATAVVLAGLVASLTGCAGATGRDDAELLPFSAGDPPQTFAVEAAPPEATEEQEDAVVPQSCNGLASATRVVEVLGVPLEGSGTFVFAGPLPDVGRTGRITCGYGVVPAEDGSTTPPAVEITLNGYVDADTAQSRLEASAEAARGGGDTVEAADLDGRPGYVLGDEEDVSFLVGDGTRTLVVTLRRGVVSPAAERLVLLDLAAVALGLPVSGEGT